MKKISLVILAVTILLSGCGQVQSVNNDDNVTKEEKNITIENTVEVTEDYNTVLQNDNKIEENIEQKEDIYVEEHELINKEDVSINISNVVQDNKKTEKYLTKYLLEEFRKSSLNVT